MSIFQKNGQGHVIGINPKFISLLVLFVIVIFVGIVANPIVIIGPAERGVVISVGEAEEKILQPGLHFRIPLVQEVKHYTVTPFEFDYNIQVGSDGAITSDNQTIGVSLSLYWSYKPDGVTTIAKMYTKETLENILRTSIVTSVKATLGKYTIFDIARKQTALSEEAFSELQSLVEKYPIQVTQLNLTNFDWSESFDKNIEETQIKAQQVNQKEQELKIADLESQKAVRIAESEKQALIAKAEGEKQAVILRAEGKKAEGEGIRQYNLAVAQNQAFEIRKLELEIDKIRAEKWDGRQVAETQVVVPGFGTIQAKLDTK